MCVGDIGDVISLYEQIIRKGSDDSFPIVPQIQSDCFQEFCARRLYDLNRRSGFLKDVAKSFAEASHDLLMNSCKNPHPKGRRTRIRQYSSLYVRITTGDLEKQTEILRDLIDAGVFVFAGGSNAPRTKTRDSNPIQQFKLTYRKIYGLVNFIGLAERDRYELSGTDLQNWLMNPENGKDILLRNLGGSRPEEDSDVSGEISTSQESMAPVDVIQENGSESEGSGQQIPLFSPARMIPPSPYTEGDASYSSDLAALRRKIPTLTRISSLPSTRSVDWLVIGAGFEERCLESVRRLCAVVQPSNVMLVQYTEPGKSAEILSLVASSRADVHQVEYSKVLEEGMPLLNGSVIVDVTGLAKPAIFHSIRNEVRQKRSVCICHTEAQLYYPLDKDLEKALKADSGHDYHVVLDELRGILTGEEGPYRSYMLLNSDSDETRQRVVCLFSSPKHERLLSLLDDREYDRVEIVAPKTPSNRGKIAQIAAEVAARNNANSTVTNIDSNDLVGVLEFMSDRYKYWYIDQGLNLELGLTGSKLQAAACAIMSGVLRVSQCWYLGPKSFDPYRFTTGIGSTQFYEIALKE